MVRTWRSGAEGVDLPELAAFTRHVPTQAVEHVEDMATEVVQQALDAASGSHVALSVHVDALHTLATHQATLPARVLSLGHVVVDRYLAATADSASRDPTPAPQPSSTAPHPQAAPETTLRQYS